MGLGDQNEVQLIFLVGDPSEVISRFISTEFVFIVKNSHKQLYPLASVKA